MITTDEHSVEQLVSPNAEVTNTYEQLSNIVDIDKFDFGTVKERENRLRDFAEALISTPEGGENIDPNAFRGALKIFFGRHDALDRVGGGQYRPDITSSAIDRSLNVPKYGHSERKHVNPMQDLDPKFLAKAFVYTVAVLERSPDPSIELQALGTYTIEKVFDIENSKYPESAKALLAQDILQGEFSHILSGFTVEY